MQAVDPLTLEAAFREGDTFILSEERQTFLLLFCLDVMIAILRANGESFAGPMPAFRGWITV